MEPDVFSVDVDGLSHTVDRMAACGSVLHELAADLEHRAATLHISWNGDAAAAHQVAQAEWAHGFRHMREALAAMRDAAGTAQGNYTSAAESNRQQWEQVL